MILMEDAADHAIDAWTYSVRLLKSHPTRFNFARLETLIRFLDDEFELSRFRNKILRNLISEQLRDPPLPLKAALKNTEFGAVIDQIAGLVSQGDTLTLRVSITDAIVLLDKGVYVSCLCDALRRASTGPNWDRTVQEVMIDELIVAFIWRGFGLDEARDILPSALRPTIREHGGFFEVKFPSFPFAPPEYGCDETQWKAYSHRQAQHATSASIDERFESIVRLFTMPPTAMRYMAQVKGVIVGTPQKLGDIDIYPIGQRFIKSNDFESFQGHSEEQRSNIAVVVSARTFDHGTNIAMGQFRVACDILNAWFRAMPPIEVAGESMIVADLDGNLRHSRSVNVQAQRFHYPHASLDFDSVRNNISFWNVLDRAAKRCVGAETVEDERLRTALGFLSRGNASEPEEAVLYYWIGIDALLTVRGDAPILKSEEHDKTELVAMKFFPAAAALNERHARLRALYDRLLHTWENRQNVRFADIMKDVPEDLCIRSQLALTPFELLDLGKLLQALPEWYAALPSCALRDHVAAVKRFFEDSGFASEELTAVVRRAALETSLIYQIRNRLVHHAHGASDTLQLFRIRAASMLTLVINYAADENFAFPEAVALTINIWERLAERLKRRIKTDLWAYEGNVRAAVT
jgi:hypothetical protein